jgi:hypothetical protein
MPLPIEVDKEGKLKVRGADNNTPAQRKELDRLAQLELRKVGTDKRDEWFEEIYKGEKVAGPDAFKSAMGHDWGEGMAVAGSGREWLSEQGVETIKVISPKDLKDLEKLRKTPALNWDGMSEKFKQELIENWDEELERIGSGKLKDRNRTTILKDGLGVQIEREPQFDVRGWRFDASQHYGGQTTENLPWASKDWSKKEGEDKYHWSKYLTPHISEDGKELRLMWINPRMPKGLTEDMVIDDYFEVGKDMKDVIGESTRLAEQGDKEKGIKGRWGFGEAYREDYAKARKAEGKGGTVPSASEGPLSPAMKAQKTIRIRSAEEEERRLMEEPLKKGKK